VGVAGCIPALNYRTTRGIAGGHPRAEGCQGGYGKGAFGFNLIVNKSNPKAAKQLETLCEEGCDFIITSLGSPERRSRRRTRWASRSSAM
jgi:nitronate monooxygenase